MIDNGLLRTPVWSKAEIKTAFAKIAEMYFPSVQASAQQAIEIELENLLVARMAYSDGTRHGHTTSEY